MSNIRIYSKKAFAFGTGASRDGKEVDLFVTTPRAFQEMPAKYATDATFKLAVAYGDVIVYNDVPKVAVPEIPSVDESFDDDENKSDTDVVDKEKIINEFRENLKIANAEKVEELATQYGSEFVKTDALKINKKRVMEAYKLSLNN
mgnify:CR=1 FL=1